MSDTLHNTELEDEFAQFAAHAEKEKGGEKQPENKVEQPKEPENKEPEEPKKDEGKEDEIADIDALDNTEEEPKKEEPENKEPELEDLNADAAKGEKPQDTEQDKIIATLTQEVERLKQQPKYANPEIEKLNEYVSNGGKITKEFWELQSKDYSEVDIKNEKSALSVLKDKLKFEEGLDDATIEKIMRKEYPILTGRKEEGEYDDDERDDEVVSLTRDAKNALPKLKEIQDKAKLPDVNHQRSEEIERITNLYRAQSREGIKDYQGLVIALDDDLRVKATPSDKTRQFINSVVTEPKNQGDVFFQKRYVNEQGRIDFDKFASEMQLLDEWKDISRKIYQQGLKRGERKAVSRELLQEPDEATASNPKGVQGSRDAWIKDAAQVIEKQFSI